MMVYHAWSFDLIVAQVEPMQMPGVGTDFLGIFAALSLKFVCRYCVIQWEEEKGSCIVKGHNLPYWLMTEDSKRTLATQGVAAFARTMCAMLRCHERRKIAVAQLQKCHAVSKVSSSSVRPLNSHHCYSLISDVHFSSWIAFTS